MPATFGSGRRVTRPEVALLVSTFEMPWHLRQVLASITAQEGVDGCIELVVTDDGSRDDTPQVVADFARQVDFPVSFTTHPHAGFRLTRCRNQGVAASKAPYLLFLDGDCVLPPDHVKQHLDRRRSRRVMGGYCCRLDRPTSDRFDERAILSQAYLDWVPRHQLRSLAVRDYKSRFYRWIRHPSKPRLAGGNVGIWREDYERVNGYDECFVGWGGEDDDLRLRLRRSGVQIESILRWTRTYHLWHPAHRTTPQKIGDGDNVDYLHRRCRLTRCMHGLVTRQPSDLAVRLVGQPEHPHFAAAMMANSPGREGDWPRPEVEILFLPGKGRFSDLADCNILVVHEHSPRTARLAAKAHFVVADLPVPGIPEAYLLPLSGFARAFEAIG